MTIGGGSLDVMTTQAAAEAEGLISVAQGRTAANRPMDLIRRSSRGADHDHLCCPHRSTGAAAPSDPDAAEALVTALSTTAPSRSRIRGRPARRRVSSPAAGARKEAQLARAVASRDMVGQAKGIPMERYKISGELAFLLLTRISQTSNRKLHDVAEELVISGAVPGVGAPPPAGG